MLIRDPIHGDIELSLLETAVLDLPCVQRLRGIKQLGTAFLVYPGAVHTRFEHSLGACAVAHRIVAALRRQGTEVPAEQASLIGAAALLHDVTHVPFGHTLEDERRLFPRHDKGDRLSGLFAGPLGSALEKLGVRSELGALLGVESAPEAPWTTEIVSSTIDADLLDYLRRDSRFAGLEQDYDDRVFRYFTVRKQRLTLRMSKHGMERPDARSEIVEILRMRYFLTERVYYHHTKVVAGAMISRAVEAALDAGELAEADLLLMSDDALLARLRSSSTVAARELATRVSRRDLLKRAYVVSAHTVPIEERRLLMERFHESRPQRAAAESELARALGVAPHEVILYCPALTVMKEAAVLVDAPGGVRPLNEVEGSGRAEINALEERYAGLWRLYLFTRQDLATRAAQAGTELLGRPSEHGTAQTS